MLALKAPQGLYPWVPFVIRWLKRTIHQDESTIFWMSIPRFLLSSLSRLVLKFWGVTYSVELENLDPDGMLFASNHPFGGMDGMMLAGWSDGVFLRLSQS